MKVIDIACSRSGDKGQISNICAFTYQDKDWPLLLRHLTVERVREKFGNLVHGDIVRYELESLRGLNFVMYEALDGGVSITLRLDPHGKTFASLLLDIDIPEG
jgi:hypothetical protein